LVSLDARGRSWPLCASVLRRQLHRQALPSLLSAAAEDLTTPLRFHSRTESVRVQSALVSRAVCWLPHGDSKNAGLVDELSS
jgi:hypothetical protein